ncbi:MAG: peptidylprolyl isomerase [Epsilonproteobacteria bacterium]|jgi:FKBP-type peptidyl-prolyl cis-trans isomerase SlyD|nr:peptidylprolyl isomerase [Campylobacterota bacterium]OYZ66264.1 MAG: peptidylprolyl isomerase [Sulfuricurvum sp. 24-42-5]
MAIEANQIVSIEYEVRDGQNVVDSNVGGAPLVFMFGKSQVIPGLEAGIAHMSIGEKSDVLVKAADAYGDYNNDAQQELPREQFAGIDLNPGMTLYGQGEDGGTVQVIVKEVKDDNVIIDFNHPLAGKDLMFTVTISNIRDASAAEAASGIPAENAVESSGSCGTGCGCH